MAATAGYRQDERMSRQKTSALVLTIILHVLVIALLLLQKAAPLPLKVEQTLSAFLLPEAKEDRPDRGNSRAEKPQAKSAKKAAAPPAEQPPAEPPPVKSDAPPTPTTPSFLNMTSADFAASNIANLTSHKKAAGGGDDSASAYGPGEGPGGAKLYNPDWYRRPTSAELAGYLPATAPRTGWGLIACRTVEKYHVEDCQTLGESPLGSGFGRAVREAAWQFLVLPPRINGKPVIGAWVRIKITYGEINEPG